MDQLDPEAGIFRLFSEMIGRGLAADGFGVLDALPAFVFVALPDGTTLFRNRSWRDFSGLPVTSSTPLGDGIELVHPDDEPRIRERWLQIGARGEDSFEIACRVRERASGTYRPIRWFNRAWRDDAGAIVFYAGLGVVDDAEQAQLRALTDANILGIIRANTRTFAIAAPNDEFLRILGYTRADYERDGLDWRRLTPLEWAPADERALEELRTGGVCTPFEKEYVRKDGSRVPVLIGVAQLPDTDDWTIAYVLDLSPQKRAERNQRASLERLQLLVDQSRALASLIEPAEIIDEALRLLVPRFADWAIVNVRDDDGALRVRAVHHREIEAHARLQTLIGQEYLAGPERGGTGEVFRTGRPAFVAETGSDWIRTSVTPAWYELFESVGTRSVAVVPLIVGGAIVGVIGAVFTQSGRVFGDEDVEFLADFALRTAVYLENAERYQRELQLREAIGQREAQMRALADTVPAIVWSADASGGLDWYNQAWYDYTGLSRDESAGWGWQAAHDPAELPRVMQAWADALERGTSLSIEVRLRGKDGAFRTFLCRTQPMRNADGVVTRWFGTNVDIDEQQATWERANRVAARLQGLFLPERMPSTERMEVDAVYTAGEVDGLVGGDWVDVVALPDGRYLCSIGDVAGHGLDAALMAARMRYAIRDFAWTSKMPSEVLARVNDIALLEFPDTYATTLVGFVDAQRTSFMYACAGHPPPIFAPAGKAPHVLPYGGLPLGVAAELRIPSQVLDLHEGDSLALYTDGFPETFFRDADGGEGRLTRAVGAVLDDEAVTRPAEAIRRRFFGDVTPSDDAALLVIRFRARGARAVSAGEPEKVWLFHSSDARAAQFSRIELRDYLAPRINDPAALFASELILGELLANTVRHAPGLVRIVVDTSGRAPVVTLRDHGPGLLRDRPRGTDGLRESGRGLDLVASLAQSFSYAPAPGGGTEFRVVLPTTAPVVGAA